PPMPIADWLEGDWEDPEGEVAVSETKANGTEPLRFDAEPRRVEAYERWKTQHQNWANVERPARAAMKIFEQRYEPYGRIEPKVLARCREELDRGGFHPLGGNDTLEFLRRFVVQLSPRGQFAEGPPEKEAEDPKIGRAPVLFLRTRTLGFATAIEGTLDDLDSRQDLPLALLKIVGLDPPSAEDEKVETFEPGDEPEDVLLSKPANPEQI